MDQYSLGLKLSKLRQPGALKNIIENFGNWKSNIKNRFFPKVAYFDTFIAYLISLLFIGVSSHSFNLNAKKKMNIYLAYWWDFWMLLWASKPLKYANKTRVFSCKSSYLKHSFNYFHLQEIISAQEEAILQRIFPGARCQPCKNKNVLYILMLVKLKEKMRFLNYDFSALRVWSASCSEAELVNLFFIRIS